MLDFFPVLMRYGGFTGVCYEALGQHFDRPYLLALFGAMMGLSEITRAVGSASQTIVIRDNRPAEPEKLSPSTRRDSPSE
jgi:hypothetical protein